MIIEFRGSFYYGIFLIFLESLFLWVLVICCVFFGFFVGFDLYLVYGGFFFLCGKLLLLERIGIRVILIVVYGVLRKYVLIYGFYLLLVGR